MFIWNAAGYSGSSGNAPRYHVIQHNYAYYNTFNAMVNVNGGSNNDISYNFASGLSGFNGAAC